MTGDVRQWVKQAPPTIRQALQSVPMMNSIRQLRNARFQMPGAYDGAMGEDCKKMMREEYEALDEFVKALEEIK